MAAYSYSNNDSSILPHDHYNPNAEPHDLNHVSDPSENSDPGDQPRYLSHLARGKAANFFINGDAFFPAKKIVYNPKHFRDFTHYMDHLTDKLEPRFGAVRKICTPHHGHRIRDLRDLQENGVYVVAGKERFKPYQYDQIMAYDKRRILPLNYNGEPNQGRQYVTSGRIKKCETQSMLIKVWPNGEDLKGPRRVLLTPRVRPFTLPNVMVHINEILKEDCLGTVEKLYFLTGVQVSEIDQITHNGMYVACKRSEKFKRVRYSDHGMKNLSTSPRPQRKLLAPLFPRSTNNLSQSSPDQSNTSTQSSVASNSQRRRIPQENERIYPLRPLYRTPSSERTNTFDMDKEQGGVFKAKQMNRNTHGARTVNDSKETRTDHPRDHWNPGDDQMPNGYSQNSHPRGRQPQQTLYRKTDTQREPSPNKGRDIYGGYKKNTEPKSTKPPEPGHYKQFSTGNKLQDEDNAAAKIQAAFRGHQTRRELKSPKQPKTPSPNNQPSYDDRLEEYDKAAEKIQAAYRGHQTRQEASDNKQRKIPRPKKQETPGDKLDDIDNAAAKIQAAYRGHQTRKELKTPKSPQTTSPSHKKRPVSDERLKEEDEAAAKIQAAYRGYLTRKELGNKQVQPEKKVDNSGKGQQQKKPIDRKDKKNDNQAAARIQAGYRGYQTRKELALQKNMADKEEAAAKIQAGYRGYQTRKRSAMEKDAATTIQSGYRGHLARKTLPPQQKAPSDKAKDNEEKHTAASKIQAGYRGYVTRKQMAGKQPTPNDEDSYKGLDRETEAAVTIQSHYRGFRARKDFAQHRAAASNDKYWP